MKVLVDTPVWSLSLRRRFRPEDASVRMELANLVANGAAGLIGVVRQEVLSGIRESAQFDTIRESLRAFSDLEVTTQDHEEAAAFFNRCRAKGIQGSHNDFLLCAFAVRNNYPIYTTDGDFTHFAKILPIRLHA